MRRRINSEEVIGEWIPAHAVKFNHDGSVSLMTEPGQARNPHSGEPDLVLGNFEYWALGGEVYRNQIGQRGYMMPSGIPAGVRWESSLWHWNHYHPDDQIKERKHNRGRKRRR